MNTSALSRHSPTTQTTAISPPSNYTTQSNASPARVVPMIDQTTLNSLRPNTASLLAAFGLGGATARLLTIGRTPAMKQLPHPSIVLVTGQSGSGKSQMIPSLIQTHRPATQVIDHAEPVDRPLIETWDIPPREAIARLCTVGISDPLTWAAHPSTLSDGQRARYTLALMLNDEAPVIVADEFLATLDRITAKAVAWTIARAARRLRKTLIAITSHEDLGGDLQPDFWINVPYLAEPVVIETDLHHAGTPEGWTDDPAHCTIHTDLVIERGTPADYHRLAHLHYAANAPATYQSVWVARHPLDPTPAAVCVYSYPDLHSAARNAATCDEYVIHGSRETAQRLNREVVRMSRLVVAPAYRGIGLAHRILNESIADLGRKYVETTTAMGPYTSLFERLGFHPVPQTSGPTEAALFEWAETTQLDPLATIDHSRLRRHIQRLSVRKRREAWRTIWHYYHQYVVHRRTRKKHPRRIPDAADPRWAEAIDVVCRRLTERPQYYILHTPGAVQCENPSLRSKHPTNAAGDAASTATQSARSPTNAQASNGPIGDTDGGPEMLCTDQGSHRGKPSSHAPEKRSVHKV